MTKYDDEDERNHLDSNILREVITLKSSSKIVSRSHIFTHNEENERISIFVSFISEKLS
jgi:hypothetical protein